MRMEGWNSRMSRLSCALLEFDRSSSHDWNDIDAGTREFEATSLRRRDEYWRTPLYSSERMADEWPEFLQYSRVEG
jgi:hypothetical protein